MHSCYICNRHFINFEALIKHYKNEEFLTPISTYSCNKIDCPMTFQNLYTFKRHYIKKHNENQNAHTLTYNQLHPLQNELLNTRTPNTIDINLNEPSCSNFCENAVDVEPYQSTADNIAKTTVENIVEMLSKTTLEFKSNLHSKLNFSRKDVQVIQSAVCKQITSKISAALNDIILPKIKEEDDKLMLGKVLQLCSNPFDNFESEYMYFKHLKENNLYAESTDFVINDEATAVLRAGVPYIEEVKLTGTLLPFSFIVKKFFELPNVLKMTLENMKELELSNVEIKNFINGKVWKDKVKKYPNQILIPYFVYFDDFEINDPNRIRVALAPL